MTKKTQYPTSNRSPLTPAGQAVVRECAAKGTKIGGLLGLALGALSVIVDVAQLSQGTTPVMISSGLALAALGISGGMAAGIGVGLSVARGLAFARARSR